MVKSGGYFDAYENFLNERGRDGWTLVSSVRIFRKPAGTQTGSGGPFVPSSDISELLSYLHKAD